jgi:tetratricopeptide (TPR) repeat protein
MMKKLDHADEIHLNAAEGWLGLGDLNSANDELEEITPEFRVHPAVLLMRCQIYQAAKKWDAVIVIAETLVNQLPKLEDPWIQRSYALHELRRTQEAYDLLLPAVKMFPKLPVVQYNLACYACQLGKLKEALNRLQRAIELGGKRHDIRMDALDDPDLEPLWRLIGEI